MKACFWVKSVELIAVTGDERQARVTLQAKFRADGTNIDWSKYTPSGEMWFVVSTNLAVDYWTERLAKDQLIEFSDIGVDTGVVGS